MKSLSSQAYRAQYPLTGVHGFEQLMKRLNAELLKLEGRAIRGLVIAADEIRVATESTPPLTPVDLGNLRASWFTVTSQKDKLKYPEVRNEMGKRVREGRFRGPQAAMLKKDYVNVKKLAEAEISSQDDLHIVMMGYTAHYAVHVHEGPHGNIGANFQRPGAGIKWFEAAIGRNAKKILKLVADNAQIK